MSFYRNWEDYKKGFGTSDGEYWLGIFVSQFILILIICKTKFSLKTFFV